MVKKLLRILFFICIEEHYSLIRNTIDAPFKTFVCPSFPFVVKEKSLDFSTTASPFGQNDTHSFIDFIDFIGFIDFIYLTFSLLLIPANLNIKSNGCVKECATWTIKHKRAIMEKW